MNQMFPIIDQVIKNNMIYRFENELEQISGLVDPEKCESDCEANIERKKNLEQIITTLFYQKNSHNIKQEKLQTHVAILREKPFQKKWHYLDTVQKLDRLNAYMVTNNISDDLKKKYLEYFEKKGIASKEVLYDPVLARITELHIDDNKLSPAPEPEKQDEKHMNDDNKNAKPLGKKRIVKKTKVLSI